MHNGALSRSALGSLGAFLPCFRADSGIVLELREVMHRSVMELAQPRAGAALDVVFAALRIEELPRIGKSVSVDGSSLLGIGPGLWLLIASDDSAPHFPGAKLVEAFEAAVETGDAWTQFAISGSVARDLLAKGCALDLHAGVFREDACAVTRFAQIRCVLYRVRGGFRLFVGRSYAISLAEWLIEAAAEFGLGLEVKAPAEAPSGEARPYNHST